MERLSDFADGQKCAGSRLFGFQRLVSVALNQPDESVQDRQRNLGRLALGCLQGFDYFGRFLGIGHVRRYLARVIPLPAILKSVSQSPNQLGAQPSRILPRISTMSHNLIQRRLCT